MNLYQQVQTSTDSSGQLNKRVFASIRLYLQDYKDTSKSKADRKVALENAKQIVEYIVLDLNSNLTGVEAELLYFGFLRISQKIAVASVDFDHVYDVKDELGFLAILER